MVGILTRNSSLGHMIRSSSILVLVLILSNGVKADAAGFEQNNRGKPILQKIYQLNTGNTIINSMH